MACYVPLLIIALILIRQPTTYTTTLQEPEYLVGTTSGSGDASIDGNFEVEESIQLNDNVAHRVYNRESICVDPYKAACFSNESPILDLIKKNNANVLKGLIEKRLKGKFYEKCRRFHRKSYKQKLQALWNHTLAQRSLDIVSQLNRTNLVESIILLHREGMREPFHLNLLTTGAYELGQPLYLVDHVHYCSLIVNNPQMTNDYRKLHNDIYYTRPVFKFLALEEVQHQFTHFPFFMYAHTNTKMNVDTDMLHHFEGLLSKYTLSEWRNYLNFVVYKGLLHQTRLLLPTTQDICFNQFLDLFPLVICRAFKDKMGERLDLERISNETREYFQQKVIQENIFHFPQDTLKQLENGRESLLFEMNHCATRYTKNTLDHLETLYYQNNTQPHYLDVILSLNKDPQFQERRNREYDSYYRELILNYIQQVNAWYDEKVNSITIPPGVLHLPRHVGYNSYQFHVILRTIIYHEYFHFLFAQVKTLPTGKKFEEFSRFLWKEYGYPNVDVHEENMADNFGFYLSFHSWVDGKSIEEVRGFFLSYIRLWCGGSNDPTHAPARDRVTLTMRVLQREFNRAFNCTTKVQEIL